MQTKDMDSIIVGLLTSSANGLSTVMQNFKNNGTPVTPQSFSIDVKFVWMVDFTLQSTTTASGSAGFLGWGLSVSETLSLQSQDKQTFTVEVKADLVPLAPPKAAAA